MSSRARVSALTLLALALSAAPAAGRGVSSVLAQRATQAGPQATRQPPAAAPGDDDLSIGIALCARGNAKSCNVVGALYTTGMHGARPDPAQALTYFQKACTGGYAIGCANLANQYYNGLGIAPDRARAVQIYQKACDLGAVTACVDLGVIYRDGRGNQRKDQPYAVKLFQRGCDLSTAACASLASMYELGWGVPTDLARAKALYQRSCYAARSDAAEDIQKVWSTAACNVLSRMK